MTYKLGSLFDGSGGFPLAGFLCGIEPVWAAEIEPYPIAVTRSRFPMMKHYGDISKVNGAEIEPVDIVSFGAPCQDLSVAGLRKGLRHEDLGNEETTRSGLFMEAVRIIKEMREATNGEYPKFCIYENVPGAFSSSKGEDFRTVLEELIKIVEPGASMPAVPSKGWAYSDSYIGDGWSLAYRVFDAQYWGVPQRRRRIYLVLDLRGECAREVLFEREGLRGYFTEGRTPWKGTSVPAEGSAGAAGHAGENSFTLKIRSGCEGGGKGALVQTNKSATLSTLNDQYLFQPIAEQYILDDQGGQQISVRTDGKTPTLRAEMHGNIPCVVEAAGFKELNSAEARSIGYGYEIAPTLSAGKHDATVCMKEQYLFENHSQDTRYTGPLDVCPMLPAQLGTGGNNTPFVVEKGPVCYNGENITSPYNRADPQPGDPCHTLGTDSRNYVVCGACVPINDKATRWKGGGKTRNEDGSGNGLGIGCDGDPSPTLTSGDRHAVAYAMQGFGDYKDCGISSGIKARDYKDATDLVVNVAGVDCRNMNESPELYPTLQAKPNGGQSLNYSGAVRIRYIVRRLTPTECARLQGFADRWGDIEKKDAFTDEEYDFWLNVRNTHAEVYGKPVKNYTKEQMLSWYKKLQTDGAEYKMWGNGISLPTALYCLQGIKEALCKTMIKEEK